MKVEPDIQDGPAGTGRPGQWWIASLVSLVVFSSLGFVFGVTARDGLASYFWLVCGFFIGATLCVLFATISFARNETHRVWAVIPALGLLLWGLSKLAQQWQSAHDFKVYSAYIEQLEADPEIALREHWPSNRATVQSRAFFDAVWAPYVEFSASQVEIGRAHV